MTVTGGVVIVGGAMAALRTAEALRRHSVTLPVTIIGSESYLPYNRPPLSKEALRSRTLEHADLAFPLRDSVAHVQFVTGREVRSSDLESGIVTDSEGDDYSFEFLVAATGLRPRRSELAANLAGVHVLHSLDDALALRPRLRPGARLVISGSGFVALELAATARGLGCQVTVVARGDKPLGLLGPELSAALVDRHASEGVRFVLGHTIAAVHGEEAVEKIEISSGEVVSCDVYVEAIGSIPNTEWLEGNDLDLSDGVLTDSHLRAVRESGQPWPNVYAVGDVARFPHWLAEGLPRRVGHWSNPTDSAKHVATEIAHALDTGVTTADFEPIPSFWSDQYDFHLFSLGLPELHDTAITVQGACDGGECVVEYHRDGRLVGVAGVGLRSVVQGYREQFIRGKVAI